MAVEVPPNMTEEERREFVRRSRARSEQLRREARRHIDELGRLAQELRKRDRRRRRWPF
jgi:ribosome recycling factor